MKTVLRRCSVVILAGFLIGCAFGPGSLFASPSPVGPGGQPGIFDGGPPVDWDHPYGLAGRQNVDQAALVANPASLGLSITPIEPKLSGAKLRWIDVSAPGPGTTVAYMFDFSGQPGFSADSRVAVQEWKSDSTQDELINTNWVPAKPTFIPVGPITIVVRPTGGHEEAWIIYKGTFYDIDGPALGSAQATDIATELADQLVGSVN